MIDDQLLDDLRVSGSMTEAITKFQQQQIITYNRLFALLRDEDADSGLRTLACWVVHQLWRNIDRRRAVPSLLIALKSKNDDVCTAAAHALGTLQSKRAADPLLEIITNVDEPILLRIRATNAVCMIESQRVSKVLRDMIFDSAQDVRIRSEIVEFLPHHERLLDDCIRLLADELADIRFWAAYRLSQLNDDISPALQALDHIATDTALPQGWGWHVGREALKPIEDVLYRSYHQNLYRNDEEYVKSYNMRLISPAAEYHRFVTQYRRWHENRHYETLPQPPIKLRTDPDWFREAILRVWPDTVFGGRANQCKTYVLDWHLVIDSRELWGGLHQDQYAIVLTGGLEAIFEFASWYRRLIPPDTKLYLYDWADEVIELSPQMTGSKIAAAESELLASQYQTQN